MIRLLLGVEDFFGRDFHPQALDKCVVPLLLLVVACLDGKAVHGVAARFRGLVGLHPLGVPVVRVRLVCDDPYDVEPYAEGPDEQ